MSDGRPRTHQEISEGIGLNPSTTFRLLATLSYYNYIKRDEHSNQYRLGLACLELAHAYQVSDDLRQIAFPELEALRERHQRDGPSMRAGPHGDRLPGEAARSARYRDHVIAGRWARCRRTAPGWARRCWRL